MTTVHPRRKFLADTVFAAVGGLAARRAISDTPIAVSGSAARPARALDAQAITDILVGCNFLGCGGGGNLSDGTASIAEATRDGLRFALRSVSDLADDDWVASPYGIGSTAPLSEAEKLKYAELARPAMNPVEASFRHLSEFLKRPFVAAIPGELGPGSTAEALATAARLGIPTLDADRVGRATPEATQDSVQAAGLSTVPLAAVTGFGDALILDKVAAGSRVEDILRAISVASRGDLGVTDAALSGRDARRPGALVVGSLSFAERLGQAHRRALGTGGNPIAAVIAAGNGFHLFEGRVVESPWKDEAGFLKGEVLIEGSGPCRGSRYRIRFMNENLMSWRDEKIDVMPPDLISVADTRSGAAITNPEFTSGQQVTVAGFRAPAIWRTPAGLKVFGPAHFGLDLPYVEIERRPRA